MKYCTYCGNLLNDDAKFCTNCGNKVLPDIARPNNADAGQNTAYNSYASGPQKPKKNNNAVLIIIIGAIAAFIAFVVIIAGIYCAFSFLRNNSDSPALSDSDSEYSESADKFSSHTDEAADTETSSEVDLPEDIQDIMPPMADIYHASGLSLDSAKIIPVSKEMTSESSEVIQDGFDSSAYSAFDGDIVTSWQDGVDGDGIGEWIQVDFSERKNVKTITLNLGCWRSEERFNQNNVPSSLSIDTGIVVYTFDFPEEMSTFAIDFDKPINSDSFRFIIEDVYKGTDWDDTAISEITFYGE